MIPALNATDCGLPKARSARQLFLRETTCNASDPELRSEACGEVA